MNTKIKNIVISCSFGIFLVLFMIVNIFAKDKEISYEERRKLAQLPEFKIEKLLNGNKDISRKRQQRYLYSR